MAYKDPQDPRSAQRKREHYERNRQSWAEKRAAQRAHLLALVNDLKNAPCVDCGVRYPPYVMDFDHRDPNTKYRTVSQLLSHGSERRVVEEIDKCDLVCSNCHRERTHGSRG